MNPITQRLHDLGQSLWLDNITREILTNGTLARYASDLSVTGLGEWRSRFRSRAADSWHASLMATS